MKKLTSADSIITINHYKNVLESEGIAAEIRNEHLSTIFGEVPFTEIWPELWIKNDLDFDRASANPATDGAEEWRKEIHRHQTPVRFRLSADTVIVRRGVVPSSSNTVNVALPSSSTTPAMLLPTSLNVSS